MTPDLVGRVRREVARSARRTRNGVRYVTGSGRARVGMTPQTLGAARFPIGFRSTIIAPRLPGCVK